MFAKYSHVSIAFWNLQVAAEREIGPPIEIYRSGLRPFPIRDRPTLDGRETRPQPRGWRRQGRSDERERDAVRANRDEACGPRTLLPVLVRLYHGVRAPRDE